MSASPAVYAALESWTTVGGIVASCPGLTISAVRRSIGYYGRRHLLEVRETSLGPMWRRRRQPRRRP